MITLIHPEIDPVILSFGNIAIRWYGLSYVIGFLLGYILIKKINKYLHEPLKEKIIEELFIWITLGVIIGGRIGYILFYQTDLLFYDPIKVFYVAAKFSKKIPFFAKKKCVFWYQKNTIFSIKWYFLVRKNTFFL